MQLCTRKIQDHIGEGVGLLVFDSATTMVGLVGEEKAMRFIQVLNARIREVGLGLTTMTSGVHSKSFEASMRSSHDLIFELKIEVCGERVQRYF